VVSHGRSFIPPEVFHTDDFFLVENTNTQPITVSHKPTSIPSSVETSTGHTATEDNEQTVTSIARSEEYSEKDSGENV